MAVTQTQVDALETAIVSGVLTVEYDGHRTTYRSMAELREAHRFAKEQVGTAGDVSDTESVVSFSRD